MGDGYERKIPCQISLTLRQIAWVKDEAARQEISFPEVIRRIVDHYLDQLERIQNGAR